MKSKLPLIAMFVAMVGLSACGAGKDDEPGPPAVSNDPATLTKTDTVVGAGPEATSGILATVTYTGWLYSGSAADHKGARFDGASISFRVGSTDTVKGFDQGVQGMKVGGKRTLLVPSSLGYGAIGAGAAIPPNAGLVFDVELTAVAQ
jgi:FKBP-type peptidyl-prolyl cis-trans isomerase FkpA